MNELREQPSQRSLPDPLELEDHELSEHTPATRFFSPEWTARRRAMRRARERAED